MTPERTNYLTNGVDGIKRLAQGPELSSYRGLQIIPTRKFSMDAGTAPRDLLKRRVRVAEYYRIPYHTTNRNKMYEFYDQSRDTMFKLTYQQLLDMADLGSPDDGSDGNGKWRHGNLKNYIASPAFAAQAPQAVVPQIQKQIRLGDGVHDFAWGGPAVFLARLGSPPTD